jgi:hypothetical protein
MELKMKYILLLLIIVFSADCSRKIQSEIEPNNNLNEANEINIRSEVKGKLSSPSDKDYFTFSVDSEINVKIEVSALKGINHAFGVFSASGGEGAVIKYVDDARKSSPEKLANLTLSKGKYYIAVSHGERDEKKGDDSAEYILSVYASDSSVSEIEPNDFFDSAQKIEYGAEITGYFSPAFNKLNQNSNSRYREEDIFYFSVDASEENPAVIDCSLSGVKGINSVIEVCDADGNSVFTADFAGEGKPESVNGLGLMKSGNYYVRVYSKSMTENFEDKYFFSLKKGDFSPERELESNDDFGKANPLQEKISGTVSDSKDVDYFFRQSESGRFYSVSVLGNAVKASIFDKSYRKIYSSDNASGSIIFPNIFCDGGYYISVSSRHSSEPQDYTISISEYEAEKEFEKEPNDSIKSAEAVEETVKGYYSYSGDKDYYKINPGSREKIKFKVRGIDDTDMTVSVTDALGYRIKTVSVNGASEIEFSETVDVSAYLIVEFSGNVSDSDYSIDMIKQR